jgi:hypothetical protein
MGRVDLERMDLDQLWALHLAISDVLKNKIERKKVCLDAKMRRLQEPVSAVLPVGACVALICHKK